MKVFLMQRDRDFDLHRPGPPNEPVLAQDLELDALFDAMACGDKFLLQAAKRAMRSALATDPDTIRYRQDVLRDCLNNPAVVRDVYALAAEAVESEKRTRFSVYSKHPSTILFSALRTMEMFADRLKKLRKIADGHAGQFGSEGFAAFFAMLREELDDAYFDRMRTQLRELEFRGGVLVSAELGAGNLGTNYVLRKPAKNKQGWLRRIFAQSPPAYTYAIGDRDEQGARALAELKERGLNRVANALAQSADHIQGFFSRLQGELAFFVGGLNLHERLAASGVPTCFPRPAAPGERRHSFRDLRDVALVLAGKHNVVGNDLQADRKDLWVVTGANEGGKTTFLRSVGVAQLMMQCGLFVAAESFEASLVGGLFTHYRRKEDRAMKSGKLDEELARMSEIVDQLVPDSLVLFNESFAATNEREGSEIARQILGGLLDKGVRAVFVTHLFELAKGLHGQNLENVLFLRAERKAGGGRTYKIAAAEPLQTSHGEDLYERVFGAAGAAPGGGPAEDA